MAIDKICNEPDENVRINKIIFKKGIIFKKYNILSIIKSDVDFWLLLSRLGVNELRS